MQTLPPPPPSLSGHARAAKDAVATCRESRPLADAAPANAAAALSPSGHARAAEDAVATRRGSHYVTTPSAEIRRLLTDAFAAACPNRAMTRDPNKDPRGRPYKRAAAAKHASSSVMRSYLGISAPAREGAGARCSCGTAAKSRCASDTTASPRLIHGRHSGVKRSGATPDPSAAQRRRRGVAASWPPPSGSPTASAVAATI